MPGRGVSSTGPVQVQCRCCPLQEALSLVDGDELAEMKSESKVPVMVVTATGS